ncbi:MAG: STAS/SEC14 domain-containing protein [archaeon]|nr:STAS/SEC14 domain-containing protein [archaeon]
MSVQLQKRIKFIKHKGKQIYFADVSDSGGEELLALLDEDDKFRKAHLEEIHYLLIDTTDANITRPCLAKIKETMTIEHPNLKKSAIVGVTGVKKALLAAANRFGAVSIKPFATLDEAKDWLIS